MELQAHELRIGNLFQEQNSKEIIMVTELSQFKISFSGSFKNNWQPEPILLTEEWLLKFGFEYKEETECYHYSNLIINKLFIMMDIDIRVYIKYVHQLQNLYFALTGEELKLNDPLQ